MKTKKSTPVRGGRVQDELAGEFTFADGDRTFTCSIGSSSTTPPEAWWWFAVSTERFAQRYAPFRRASDDTRDNVRPRIVAYYDDLVARRAMPAAKPWARRGAAATEGSPAPSGGGGPE